MVTSTVTCYTFIYNWQLKILTYLLICLISFYCHSSHGKAATPLNTFQVNSLAQIEAQRAGQPFILVLWSIDCPPCLHELKTFKSLNKSALPAHLILVSTDSTDLANDVEILITDFKLEAYEHWIFADAMPERVRFSIDSNWYGELPRAYFYESNGSRMAHSGVLKKETIEAWLNLISNQETYK